MYASDNEAQDAIFAVLSGVWAAQTIPLVGYPVELRWPGRFEDKKPPTDKIWGRVSTQTVLQTKAHLTNGATPDAFTTDGLLYLQLFAPLADAADFDKMNLLARAVRDGYRSAQLAGGAFFRNERVRELPNDEKYYRCNVVVEYQYDALGG